MIASNGNEAPFMWHSCQIRRLRPKGPKISQWRALLHGLQSYKYTEKKIELHQNRFVLVPPHRRPKHPCD